jgi:hypothetical protein
VISCVSLPEPDSNNQTLVVGIIRIQGPIAGGSSQTSTYKNGVQIILQEFNGYKTYGLISGPNGLFYTTRIPQGVYKLIKVIYPMQSGGTGTVDHTSNPERIEIVNGKVNNFGTISGALSGGYMSYEYNREYEQVRTLFRQKYSSSNWNQKEWINIGINRANSGGNVPPTAPVNVPVSGVNLNKKAISLGAGATETLFASLTPANAANQNVMWYSNNIAVASVSTEGLVTAVAPGQAAITVRTVTGNRTDTCTVTVSGTPQTVPTGTAQAAPAAPTQAPVIAQPAAPAQAPAPAVQQNVPAPQTFALVIGNETYRNLSRLSNPANDANDMAAALQSMGFTVDKLIDASQEQMDSAVIRLKNRLSVSTNSYGFFFYAGHGVQSNGENFLIPVDANIPGENYLRSRAVSVQVMLDELNDAKNELNMIVLDACRDNPFGWARAGSRGLAVLSRQPADSIIVYATSAGSTASDGTGRNGLFTSQLLKNLTTPGLEITEIFRRTGADVRAVSSGQQIPAIYSQFFGTAFLKN